MTYATDLVDELQEKGGLLGILKSFLSKPEELARQATEIWHKAFPKSKVIIPFNRIGSFYGLFKGIYRRAHEQRKKQLEPYLKQFEKIHDEYKQLRGLDLSEIEKLVADGETVYNMSTLNERSFLYALHSWIAEVYTFFMENKDKYEDLIPDLYKFIDVMIYILIDVSTEYTSRPPGSFEFVLSVFIHIENFVHESSESYEPFGQVPVAISYLIKLMDALSQEAQYHMVFPFHHVGSWSDNYYIIPFTPYPDLEAPDISKVEIQTLASQIGIDVKDNVSYLLDLEQKFPAHFLIYDHLRGVIRREAKALLKWDFLKHSIQYIVKQFKWI